MLSGPFLVPFSRLPLEGRLYLPMVGLLVLSSVLSLRRLELLVVDSLSTGVDVIDECSGLRRLVGS